jgi:hypothetical protein
MAIINDLVFGSNYKQATRGVACDAHIMCTNNVASEYFPTSFIPYQLDQSTALT